MIAPTSKEGAMTNRGERRYYKKLVGERCYLSPMNPDDASKYCAWLNDLEVSRNLTMSGKNVSLVGEREYLEQASKSHNYAIVTTDEDRLIGNCGLGGINHLHGTCEIGIFIGNKDYWGKGYGPEAMKLLAAYAFDYLNMRNIMLIVYSFNERAIKAYRKIGFHEMGRRRNAYVIEGGEHDIVYMDMLRDDLVR
jgi:RimJ/RimL family protein N-acetyltransferase